MIHAGRKRRLSIPDSWVGNPGVMRHTKLAVFRTAATTGTAGSWIIFFLLSSIFRSALHPL